MDFVVVGLPETVAQEEQITEEEVEHNPIIPEVDELIVGSLAFLLVFAVLAKFAFPRINEALKGRTEKIQGDLERAEQAKGEAEALVSRYEEQLRDARNEANRIIEEARQTAETMRADLMAKAEEDARRVVAKAQEEIRGERDRAFEELRRSLGEISVELAGRVVGESLSRDRHAQMVDSYIDELTGKGGSANGSS